MKALLVIVLVAMTAMTAGAATASPPVRLSFDKTAVGPGLWQGTVDGDVSGALTTNLTALRVTGPIWHVSFDWRVDAGNASFVASLDGTLNTRTGAVVMNGRITDGWLLGARVHEEGQLVDAATLSFSGSIRIMPSTAG